MTDYCPSRCDPNPNRLPCPPGYDCRQSPFFDDGYLCSIHHEPTEILGLYCSAGTHFCAGTCVTYENEHSCAPGRGYCLHEGAGLPDQRTYCTYRCETTPCPNGYVCAMFTIDSGGPPSGRYCVRPSAVNPPP